MMRTCNGSRRLFIWVSTLANRPIPSALRFSLKVQPDAEGEFMISRILRPFAVIAFALCAASAAAQTSQWVAKASMPTARDGMASAVISGKLYVVAGCCSTFNSPFTRFTQVEVYDPATNTWSVPGTETPIPIGVYAPATAYIGDKLYVVGGS